MESHDDGVYLEEVRYQPEVFKDVEMQLYSYTVRKNEVQEWYRKRGVLLRERGQKAVRKGVADFP